MENAYSSDFLREAYGDREVDEMFVCNAGDPVYNVLFEQPNAETLRIIKSLEEKMRTEG
jgi:sensor domain CHASE-containing protein